MNSKLWIRQALSACLTFSILATASMVALADSPKITGELTVTGDSTTSQAASVFINGEASQSGRSVFSSSTVVTPDNASAIIGFGKLGKIEIAPNSSAVISFSDAGITGSLSAGKITALGASKDISITTTEGRTVNLAAGESVLATGLAKQQNSTSGGGRAWWAFAAVMVAAGAVIVWSAVKNDDEFRLGGGGTVVSPTR